ncbi:bifunctional hydroxymethylpyrimidine kinase/phosphomethylpyrimidine kinase [Dictyobacter kobayashii]|uniref:Hydroxymethylpyrimidine/phosphomethylpyrimidine kinase n=1 Tax=Dictyobacter kobayashii TaxID=2014872 RepID=A0A402AXD3_9CHLR|nr:bifunctional hydroxymethylpyrimidine kinase/phosphomethylpyrimidine kinase [Dictyobacter kobayashii]GCE23782.1 hydroxymethylpyrimidine/phosphomethylpyrimidine kinase [Dictyobacter kobayashii]
MSSTMQSVAGGTPRALTIAGSDSGGGAGIQADLKTFAALGVYGTSAITAVTAQNTRAVLSAFELPLEMIAAQIDAVMDDIGALAAKTGMLASPEIIQLVAERVRHWNLRLVVDPVMVAKGGERLLQERAIETLKSTLLPLAEVVTPNLPEAEVLVGHSVRGTVEMREAARAIHALGPRYVVVKGGHSADAPVDILFDGQEFQELRAERVQTANTHGTGCTFSAAITAFIARGWDADEAVVRAKRYVTGAIQHADALHIGHGHGPVDHFWLLDRGLERPVTVDDEKDDTV